MTEIELITFLKTHLKLEVTENTLPYDASNCKRVIIKLILNTPEKSHLLSEESFKIYEGQR